MGTNFYAIKEGSQNKIHIGKSSGGWRFALSARTDREPILLSLADWKEYLSSTYVKIEDDDGCLRTFEEMIDIIENRKAFNGKELRKNVGAISHGEGTWDMIDGEFS